MRTKVEGLKRMGRWRFDSFMVAIDPEVLLLCTVVVSSTCTFDTLVQ